MILTAAFVAHLREIDRNFFDDEFLADSVEQREMIEMRVCDEQVFN